MMKLKRWGALILMAAMLCSLVSCGSFSVNTEETTEGADPSTTENVTPPESNGPVVFQKSDLEKFKIVYATDLGRDAMAEVQKLADRIKSTYGVTLIMTSDFILSSNPQMKKWEHEILIGGTNREESVDFQRDLRKEDYGYGYKDGKILISGGNSEAVLPVLADSKSESAETAFLIGKTKFFADARLEAVSANEGCVMKKGDCVIAYGDDLQGVVNASKLLTDLLFDESSTEKRREITIGEAEKSDGYDTFSVMTHNLKVGDIPADRIARTMKLIYKYMPDTLGVQEANPTWMSALRNHLGDYYEIVGEGREGGSKGEHMAILYAKTKYNLIESGTKWLTYTPDEVSKFPECNYIRIFTWALLEDKVTGERYLHVNTHLDGGTVNPLLVKLLMRFLKDYNDVAVVLTGDMNAAIGAEEMKYLQANGFATKTDFRELDHLPLTGRGFSVIDWIFVTADCMTLTNYITDNNYFDGDYASDHNSYYAEFTVQKPADGKLDHGWEDLDISFSPEGWLEVKEDEEGANYGDLIIGRG